VNKSNERELKQEEGKEKPAKQMHINLEQTLSKEEIGNYLVEIGKKLINEGSFTIKQGQQSYEIAPAGQVKFEIQYKTKGEKQEFELEIQWKPGKEEEFEIS